MENKKPQPSLLGKWKNSDLNKSGQNLIQKAPEGVVLPLSSGQQRLWFLQQLFPSNTFYNASSSIELEGELNIDAFRKSIHHVIDQHEILKSSYPLVNGAPIIKINHDFEIAINEVDFSAYDSKERSTKIQKHFLERSTTQFDLSNGPLIAISIIKVTETRYILFLTVHHIIIDIWSIGLFKTQIARNYRLFNAGKNRSVDATELQFADYAYWQRAQQVDAAQIEFWKHKLSGELPILDLQKDRKRQLKPSYKGRKIGQEFSLDQSEKMFALAQNLQVTPFVLFLSVYALVLHKNTSQNDILIGTPLTIRSNQALENLLGFFVETLVIRNTIDITNTFAAFVHENRQNVLDVFKNKDVPFDELVNILKIERSVSINPIFQTMFVYDSETEPLEFGKELSVVNDTEFDSNSSKFDLTLFVSEHQGKIVTKFEYATDLFNESTIIRYQEQMNLLLGQVVENPEVELNEITITTAKEREFFTQNNASFKNVFSTHQGIHEIILEYAKKTPGAIAAIFKNDSITYGELDKRAMTLVPRILNYSKGENKIVGLAVERSLDMIIGILAILRAGCAYLPIDLEYPKKRIAYMLEDAKVGLVLTQKRLKSSISDFQGTIVSIDEDPTELDLKSDYCAKPNREDMAYVIYTSGSTGKPKGVPITHHNIINSTAGRLTYYQSNPTVFLLLSSFSFDSSKAGIFWTLCTGGTLLISPKHAEQDLKSLVITVKEKKVTHALMLPTLYNLFLDYIETEKVIDLSHVMVAGEACTFNLVEKHFQVLPKTNLYNEYGPTEATVWCLAHKMVKENKNTPVPIGKPVANALVYLLDKRMNLVPYGAAGEIYIGGDGLSNGYLNRPDLTKASFVENPSNNQLGDRLYKTGDLGRFNQNGEIEFLGRSDDQIKIRGYRIEINEIETIILEYSPIKETVVLVDGQKNSVAQKLLAFIKVEQPFNLEELKTYLKPHLPDYMMPSSFIEIDDLPKLPNGKIDKKKLLTLKRPQFSTNLEGDDLPRNEIEENLLITWKEVLDNSTISVKDNFFEIGGDSILSIQMLSKAREQGIKLSPNQIFEYQTIRELANFVDSNLKVKEEWSYLVPFREKGTKKPLFCLHAGGGHVFFYQGLLDHIDSERPLYAIQASGEYGKKGMHTSIQEMADDYIQVIKSRQKSGPYNILVYCFSATVGHEMAMKMNDQGDECNLIVMDTMAKPWTLNTPDRLKIRLKGFYQRLRKKPLYTLNHMVAIRLNKIVGQAYMVIGDEEKKSLEELKNNLATLSKTYEWKPFDGKISLILTDKPHESLNKETVNSWKEYAKGGIRIIKTTGQHSALFAADNLPNVAEKIEQCIKDE